jgi:hypothetical protein
VESVKVAATGESGGVEKLIEKVKGAVFTLTLDAGGAVSKFSGYDDLVKSIAKESKMDAQMFKVAFPEDMVKSDNVLIFGFAPAKAVAKGDTWKRPWNIAMGAMGNFKAENSYTYQGKTEKGAQIDFTTTGAYTPPQGDGGDAPFKITKGSLEVKSARGTIIFDPVKGRLVSFKIATVIKGKLSFEAMGNKVDAELEQEGTSTLRVTERAPSDD